MVFVLLSLVAIFSFADYYALKVPVEWTHEPPQANTREPIEETIPVYNPTGEHPYDPYD